MYPFLPSRLDGEGNPMHDRMKRHEILVIRRAGLTLREVARKTGVGLRTVQRIVRQGTIDPPAPLPVGRPRIAVSFQEVAQRILSEEGGLPTVEILRRLREEGYVGGKNPVYQMVRQLRPFRPSPMVRFEGLAGEFCQNDFGSVRVRYDSGLEEILHFFASRLKWSRWVHVEMVPNEQEEALVRALLNAFLSFGGVPLCCVFDNPKRVVIARQGDHIQWNATFGQVFLDYRFVPELCTPRSGWEKGAVENSSVS